MPKNIADKDLKVPGIVLRRTNYGEADRILNLITPVGKVAAIAKGARKEKSKLAGGIEMFSLTNFTIHRGKSELGVVTSARMEKHYSEILKDFGRMELMGMILKKISAAAEHTDGGEYFEITRQCMAELNNGTNVVIVEVWFWLNLMRVSGEEVNLYRDGEGTELVEGVNYEWDVYERAFVKSVNGKYGTNEIKLLRLMTKMDLDVVKKIKIEPDVIERVYDIIKIWEN